MNKTDKELTAEIVCTFIESWHAKQGTSALKIDDVQDMIKCVYTTIHSLGE